MERIRHEERGFNFLKQHAEFLKNVSPPTQDRRKIYSNNLDDGVNSIVIPIWIVDELGYYLHLVDDLKEAIRVGKEQHRTATYKIEVRVAIMEEILNGMKSQLGA